MGDPVHVLFLYELLPTWEPDYPGLDSPCTLLLSCFILCDGTFLGPRWTISWEGVSDSALQYLLISLVKIQPFRSLEVPVSVPAGEVYSTVLQNALHSLGDSSPPFEWLWFAKRISVSCIKKAANHWDVFCHLGFPAHHGQGVLGHVLGCIPAWLVAPCLHEELLALVQKVLLLLRCAEIRAEEKHMYWSIM